MAATLVCQRGKHPRVSTRRCHAPRLDRWLGARRGSAGACV